MAVKKDRRIRSATYLVTLLDFAEAGELGVFIDEQQIQALEEKMNKRGYLEGSEMAQTFNMLRANDLIWSFVVNNYLLGNEAFPFDLLYWNSDSTRMPAAMHSFYLRNMYQRNLLKEPGGITLKDVPIDLSLVNLPSYMLAAREDHITPWKSTYRGLQNHEGHQALRARGLRPYRGRRQLARVRQIQPLGCDLDARLTPTAWEAVGDRDVGAPGGRTGSAGSRAWRRRPCRRASRAEPCR